VRTLSLPPILLSAAFRTAAAFAAAFSVCVVLLFGFIYWETALSETARIDGFLVRQARLIASAPPEQSLWMVQTHVAADLHRVTFAALFDEQGRLIAGNLQQVPDALPADGTPHWVDAVATDAGASHRERVIAVAERLADGRLLVLGRNIEQLTNLKQLVARALALGVIPAVLLALGAGAWVGQRTWRRVRSWQRILNRVRDGDLSERLPTRANGDDVDHLAAGVNHMLDELERLLGELHNVGNNIAHDLRSPLARVRAQLERTRRGAPGREDLERAIDKAIAGLDQSLAITTALLRIAEIEGSRRRDAFGVVDLVEIVREVAEFYEPAAEQKQITLRIALPPGARLYGDRDLLFEAVANLLDNAIKFTPEGGQVSLGVGDSARGPLLRVTDTGPGIPADARDAVFKRFFRFDRSRGTPGLGLGLSLVAAIAKLHGYALAVEDGHPGCVFLMQCTQAAPHATLGPAGRQLVDMTP
jgi:signal transduction histidine kinase